MSNPSRRAFLAAALAMVSVGAAPARSEVFDLPFEIYQYVAGGSSQAEVAMLAQWNIVLEEYQNKTLPLLGRNTEIDREVFFEKPSEHRKIQLKAEKAAVIEGIDAADNALFDALNVIRSDFEQQVAQFASQVLMVITPDSNMSSSMLEDLRAGLEGCAGSFSVVVLDGSKYSMLSDFYVSEGAFYPVISLYSAGQPFFADPYYIDDEYTPEALATFVKANSLGCKAQHAALGSVTPERE